MSATPQSLALLPFVLDGTITLLEAERVGAALKYRRAPSSTISLIMQLVAVAKVVGVPKLVARLQPFLEPGGQT